MKIILEKVGQKFGYNKIFQDIYLEIKPGSHYGVIGNNGSGKTTLLKIISGILTPSYGKIRWQSGNTEITSDKIFLYLGYASPHMELIEEFTLREALEFHQKFRRFVMNYTVNDLVRISELKKIHNKPIRLFSSGMKQRVKIILSVLCENQLIILDEPCSNFDEKSISWYQNIIRKYAGDRTIIVGTNNPTSEAFSCQDFLDLNTMKP